MPRGRLSVGRLSALANSGTRVLSLIVRVVEASIKWDWLAAEMCSARGAPPTIAQMAPFALLRNDIGGSGGWSGIWARYNLIEFIASSALSALSPCAWNTSLRRHDDNVQSRTSCLDQTRGPIGLTFAVSGKRKAVSAMVLIVTQSRPFLFCREMMRFVPERTECILRDRVQSDISPDTFDRIARLPSFLILLRRWLEILVVFKFVV